MKIKIKHLYLVTAVVALIFALALFLMTSVILNLAGMDNTRDAAVLSQLLAVEMVSVGLTALLARDVTDLKARSAINYANIIASVLGFIVALNATLTGVFNWFGYVIIIIYAILAVGFVYFQFFGPVD